MSKEDLVNCLNKVIKDINVGYECSGTKEKEITDLISSLLRLIIARLDEV